MPRIDWPALRAHYVEGVAVDPDKDPNARTWPSLEEVATLHGVSYRAVAQHSSREKWPQLREEFQRQVDTERRRALVDARAKQVATIDTRGMTAADAGLALVGQRLRHLTNAEVQRGEDAGAGVDAPELAALGLAARRWLQVKDMVMGKAVTDEPADEATQERDQRVAEAVLAARLAEHRQSRAADLDDEALA